VSEVRLSPARMLLSSVRDYLNENYPGWTTMSGMLPEGLRLEMHPGVRQEVIHDRYSWGWPSADWRDWGPVFGLPVKITSDLPEGTWRLVVVTEDVLAGGKLS
jgi:hypothetical protein